MFEIKITIDAPSFADAINNLARALGSKSTAPAQPAASAPMQEAPAQPAAPSPVQEKPAQPAMPTPVQEKPAEPTAPAPVQEKPTEPAPVQETPAQPAAQAPAVDLEAISRAGAALIDQGKMQQVMALLQKYGVQAITQLQTSVYPEFANDLRDLGAAI